MYADGKPMGAGGLPELFFRDQQQLDSVERYNVVYKRPESRTYAERGAAR